IGDAHRVLSKRPQPDHSQLGVSKWYRLLCSPLQVLKCVSRYEHDAGLKRGSPAKRNRKELCQKRHVHRCERVPARTKRIQSLAVPEENRRLILLDDELRSELYVRRPARGKSVDDLRTRGIKKLYDFYCHPF